MIVDHLSNQTSHPPNVRKRTIVLPDLKVLYTPVPKANPTPLRFVPALLDEPGRQAMNDVTAADRERFGYRPVAAPADPAAEFARWQQTVEPMLPLVRELIRRHQRIDQLAGVVETGQRRRKRGNR